MINSLKKRFSAIDLHKVNYCFVLNSKLIDKLFILESIFMKFTLYRSVVSNKSTMKTLDKSPYHLLNQSRADNIA